MKLVALALVCAAGVAHADPKPAASPPAHADKPEPPPVPAAEPDEITDDDSREANLESQEGRSGFTLSGALGIGIMFGGDIGVGRGPAVSVRLGQVATRRTVITFEFVGTGALHKQSVTGETLTDSSIGLLAGAQRYTGKSVWVRAAAGLDLLSKNVMTDGSGGSGSGGVAGLVGGGLDIFRWGYLVLGLEMFAMSSYTGDGFKLQVGFSTGLSYY